MNDLPIAADALAVNGILDFDADAYIKGTRPRYVGRPRPMQYPPFEQPLMAYPAPYVAPAIHSQPHKDELVKHTSLHSWKKALLGALVAGVAIFGALKYKGKISSLFNGKVVPLFKKATANDLVKAGVNSQLGDAAQEAAKQNVGKAETFLNKLLSVPKWAKIAGGSLLGVLGLAGLYSAAASSHQNRKH